jgi:hypothetical protein
MDKIIMIDHNSNETLINLEILQCKDCPPVTGDWQFSLCSYFLLQGKERVKIRLLTSPSGPTQLTPMVFPNMSCIFQCTVPSATQIESLNMKCIWHFYAKILEKVCVCVCVCARARACMCTWINVVLQKVLCKWRI